MIDVETGSVVFSNLTIRRDTSLEQLMQVPTAKVQMVVGELTYLALGTYQLASDTWGVGAVAKGGQLTQVWLQWLNAPDINKEEHSIMNEQLRKARHDQILRMQHSGLGKSEDKGNSIGFRFSWGRVSSELDMRAMQALIVVDYTTP